MPLTTIPPPAGPSLPQLGKNRWPVFEVQNNVIGFKEGTVLTFTMIQKYAGKDHNLGKFRISVTTSKPPVLLQGTTPENISKLLDIVPAERTAEQKSTLAKYYRGIDPDLNRFERSYNEFIVPPSPPPQRSRSILGINEQPGVFVQSLRINAKVAIAMARRFPSPVISSSTSPVARARRFCRYCCKSLPARRASPRGDLDR